MILINILTILIIIKYTFFCLDCRTTIGRLGNGESQGNGTGNNSTLTKGVAGITSVLEIPTKVVSTPVTVQFTCSFSETPIAGCADTKVVKFLITKLAPSRVVVIRGSVSDCDSLVSYAKTIQIDAHAPFNGETIAFTIPVDRIRLQIPLSLMPKRLHVVRGLNASSKETQCSIVPIAGNVLEVASSSSRGLRTLRLQSLTEPQLSVVAPSTMSLTGVGYTNRDTKSGLSTGKFKAVSAVGSISATTTGAAPQVNVSLVDDFFASMFGSTSAASDSNAAALFDLDIASGIVSSTTIDASGIPIDPTATDSLEAILAGVSAPTEVTSLENILESSSETQVAPVCSDTMLIDESDVTVQVAATAVAEVEEADFEDMPMEIDTVDKSEDDEDGEEEVEGMYAGAIDSSAELSAELHTLLLRPYTVVSVGEVTLNSVKTLLESLGFSVEFKISQSGAALVCDSQVVIRKSDQMNDFILEGPPTRAFWEAKKVLKEKFAYIT